MSKSTIGARVIAIQEKLHFTCLIRKVVCCYESDEGERKKAVLFERPSGTIQQPKGIVDSTSNEALGYLSGKVTNNSSYKTFYFKSNCQGKNINIECIREKNYCTEEEHGKYQIDYIDIQDNELKTECRNVTDGKLKLYYYDLFYRDDKYGEIASSYVRENAGYKTIGAIVGRSVGDVAGSVVDFLMAFRFILLPKISDDDYKYNSHVDLYYNECPHLPGIPALTIYIYPDIEFLFNVGVLQLEREYYGDLENKDTISKSPYRVDFSVQYNGKLHQLSLDGIDKLKSPELDSTTQKATLFYKTLQYISRFFKATADFSRQLENIVGEIYGKEGNVTSDIKSLSKSFDKLSGGFGSSSSWLSGSLNINPSLALNWKYNVSDDLCHLRKHLRIEFGIQGNGMLTIDLVGIYLAFFHKAKKATTVAAAATTVASGGLAALPSILIKFLVDQVVQWLMKKFKESVRVELRLLCSVKADAFKYDSILDKHFDFSSVAVKPEIMLFAGLTVKNSISLFLSVKVEYDVGASAVISSSIEYLFNFELKKKILSLELSGKINPIKIKLEYHIVGGYTISCYKKGREYSGNTKEWDIGGHDIKPIRWEIFDFN